MILPNFDIHPKGEISIEFLKRNILTFHQATIYVRELNYGRNPDKDNLKSIFSDNKGTCSTKHALLKQLANENNQDRIKLVLGIFKMNAKNTPKVGKTLFANNLEYIPEVHNYLKYENELFDFTKNNSSPKDFIDDLIFETEIQPNEINQHKIKVHKDFLLNWLNQKPEINYSIEEIWEIREQCIKDLSE